MRPKLALVAVFLLVWAGSMARADSPAAPPPVAVPEPSPRALQYYRSGVILWVVNQAWTLFVPAVALFSGLSARLRDFSWKLGRRWFFAITLFAASCVILESLASLPMDYYQGFVRLHQYGLAPGSYTATRWLLDTLKRAGISTLLTAAGVWVPYLLLDRSPRRWWIYTALLTVPVSFTLMFLSPILVDPLFNHYGPMADPAMEAKILALAGRAGIDGGRIFQVDKSRETAAVNAYVKGFLGTKRIVLWDTLLAKLNEREVLFVMGHEMGHFVLGHVVLSLLLGSLLVLVGLGLIHLMASRMIRRFGARFGFSRLGDFASLPLLVLLGNAFYLAASPGIMAYSRWQEHEADRFALELTRDNHAGATAFVTMQRENLSNPRPGRLSKLYRATHPPLGERIDFCNQYHPWSDSKELRYEHLFRSK